MQVHFVHDIAEALPDDRGGKLHVRCKVEQCDMRLAVRFNGAAYMYCLIVLYALPVKHVKEKVCSIRVGAACKAVAEGQASFLGDNDGDEALLEMNVYVTVFRCAAGSIDMLQQRFGVVPWCHITPS